MQIYFVLSGESEFCEHGVEHDFRHFYDTRIQILEKESRKKNKRNRFEALMKYFNDALFPDENSNDTTTGMSKEELELLEAIEQDESEEEDDGPGHEGGTGPGGEDEPEMS
jgi:hypothetical protein